MIGKNKIVICSNDFSFHEAKTQLFGGIHLHKIYIMLFFLHIVVLVLQLLQNIRQVVSRKEITIFPRSLKYIRKPSLYYRLQLLSIRRYSGLYIHQFSITNICTDRHLTRSNCILLFITITIFIV